MSPRRARPRVRRTKVELGAVRQQGCQWRGVLICEGFTMVSRPAAFQHTDRCICISQNCKDRRARTDQGRLGRGLGNGMGDGCILALCA
jgi:hypothetical protein